MFIHWIFIAIFTFCIYIFFGLYATEGIESTAQLILSWVIYTVLWITFLNVFVLGYFWSVIRTKTGPYGLRGPEGEVGTDGLQGECNVNSSQAYCMKALNDYINNLYKTLTNRDILNQETQTFPCTYLNEKIKKMAGSRQFTVVVGNLATDNKGIDNLINYLKSVWKVWFELIYNGTSNPGEWFVDRFGDENYTWVGNNPFNEIRKYDVYYWGITRDFRPLKAEICRSTPNNENSKFPKAHLAKTQEKQSDARLTVIQTNNYKKVGVTGNHNGNHKGSFWSPHGTTIAGRTYYPVGDVMAKNSQNAGKTGQTLVGDSKYNAAGENGPDLRTIIATGDVVDPLFYINAANPDAEGYWIKTPVCPSGYKSIGDIITVNDKPQNNYKCLPSDCLEEVAPGPLAQDHDERDPLQWDNYWKYFDILCLLCYEFDWRSNINYLNAWDDPKGDKDANYKNGYNVMRGSQTFGNQGESFYRIKQECLEKTPNRAFPPLVPQPPPSTKEVEKIYSDLGIGWHGHPYKLDPKYSIFSYLNLVPEGMIVNQGTGHRFYIIHVEGEDINLFNILTYNNNTNKFDGSLQVNVSNIEDPNDKNIPNNKDYPNNSNLGIFDDPNSPNIGDYSHPADVIPQPVNYNLPNKRIIITTLSVFEPTQQWKIILNSNKKLFKLKNVGTNIYLYTSSEPREGLVEFTSIDLNNNNYRHDPVFAGISYEEVAGRTDFSFISSFGTQLDIIDKVNK